MTALPDTLLHKKAFAGHESALQRPFGSTTYQLSFEATAEGEDGAFEEGCPVCAEPPPLLAQPENARSMAAAASTAKSLFIAIPSFYIFICSYYYKLSRYHTNIQRLRCIRAGALNYESRWLTTYFKTLDSPFAIYFKRYRCY